MKHLPCILSEATWLLVSVSHLLISALVSETYIYYYLYLLWYNRGSFTVVFVRTNIFGVLVTDVGYTIVPSLHGVLQVSFTSWCGQSFMIVCVSWPQLQCYN